jgi:hypothetical protein
VKECVDRLAAGRGSRAGFSVTYSDQHALHAGLIMTSFGDGRVEQNATLVLTGPGPIRHRRRASLRSH